MSSKVKTFFGPSVIVFAAVWVLAILILKALGGVLGGSATPADMTVEAIAERIKPVAQLNTGAPIVAEAAPAAAAPAEEAAPAAAARSGEDVYKTTCVACHAAGAAGAPKFGDAAAWAPRIATGMDAMMGTVLNGKGAMPPRGTCGNCSDEELQAAVEYMVENSQ